MSSKLRDRGVLLRLRRLGAALALAVAAQFALASPSNAQFLPEGFFASLPQPGAAAEVEANTLNYNALSDIITATGRVVMQYSGYTLACDSLRYEQGTGAVICEGNVDVRDPQGTHYQADRLEVTGGMKEAFIESLTLTTANGARITARDARFNQTLETVLTDASYSPCGLCIDQKGNRIGWKVKAARLVQDAETKVVYFEQPRLEVLGVPVAWLPWLSLPDPSNKRNTGFQLPSVDYKPELGARLRVPYFIAIGQDTDILLAPQLMTRQGFLMAASWQQHFDYGVFYIQASGINQLNPSAFAGEVGDRKWRGALETYGHFRVAADWTVGWNYTAFSDAAYLDDYDFNNDDRLINEVYATHLSDDFFVDVRLQEFKLLGDDVTETEQNQQALTVPNARGNGYFDLGPNGQVRLEGSLLGVRRDSDSMETYGGVPYVFGYEGEKYHASGEASWQNQIVMPGGLVATPFLGIRGDVANYSTGNAQFDDGPGGFPTEPSDQLLYAATPIAAIDVRWPLIATSGYDSHLLEPIAQLVWRGSDTSKVGITNDNAHSFVLDDTNIFSYNRFSGSDRQETGLRANIGGRYLGNFGDGSWLELIAGQSFHLAGTNAMGVADEVNTGVSTGLGDDASYLVLGARGSPYSGLTLGAKLQVDTGNGPRLARAGLGADYDLGGGYSLGGDYVFLPADAATGVVSDQQEVTVRAAAPLPIDYWKVEGSTSWDLASQQWLESTGHLYYDDGYFEAGGFVTATGSTNTDPDKLSFGVSLKLKAPEPKADN